MDRTRSLLDHSEDQSTLSGPGMTPLTKEGSHDRAAPARQNDLICVPQLVMTRTPSDVPNGGSARSPQRSLSLKVMLKIEVGSRRDLRTASCDLRQEVSADRRLPLARRSARPRGRSSCPTKRAVRGRSAHLRPALPMHKHTAWTHVCSAMVGIVNGCGKLLITARRAAVRCSYRIDASPALRAHIWMSSAAVSMVRPVSKPG